MHGLAAEKQMRELIVEDRAFKDSLLQAGGKAVGLGVNPSSIDACKCLWKVPSHSVYETKSVLFRKRVVRAESMDTPACFITFS